MVADAIRAAHGAAAPEIEIVPIRTSGDRIQDRALAEVGGKALWTKELDRALLGGEIDFAVHSMKDVETHRPATIAIAALLPRADVRDRLIGAESVAALPQGARIGTSSPRRSAQLRALRPDVEIVLFRGNVATRLAKLAAGEAEATLLAAAGLDRLGQAVGHAIPIETMLPAPAQGAVGVEARADDGRVLALLGPIDHAPTRRAVEAERALLAALGADCRSPVAALAREDGGLWTLAAELLDEAGSARVSDAIALSEADAPARLAARLLDRAPARVRALFTGP
ncbi:hydroxymethylbilane synthase [Sphingomonas jatrophae]|uniref:Hydroxymethylbilane synthase n=2 Tax=Sphingomonas jatrophae TaxID=1166337 RepID=A0A1I6M8E7_9SPHN|nr:hydroxymethylbilane synthase [Sphingomonas jatrophae]